MPKKVGLAVAWEWGSYIEFHWPRQETEFRVRFAVLHYDVHKRGYHDVFTTCFGTTLSVSVPVNTEALYIFYEKVQAVSGQYQNFIDRIISKGHNKPMTAFLDRRNQISTIFCPNNKLSVWVDFLSVSLPAAFAGLSSSFNKPHLIQLTQMIEVMSNQN